MPAFGEINSNFSLSSFLLAMIKPVWWDASANRLRGTTLVESGTVTTVTGLTNMNSWPAHLPVISTNLSSWAAIVRARIT